MKIKYLGTAAAEGIPAIFCDCEECRLSREKGGKNIRTRSQALIDDKILIDFPADTYMHFLLHNVPLNKIKTCIVTHSHQDHLYAEDAKMRTDGFANLKMKEPLTFYSAKSGYDMIKSMNIPEDKVEVVRIEPFESFFAEGYKITPVKAAHDPDSTPVIYAVEKDGKSILYANDTGDLCEESLECLKNLNVKFNLISLDCTMGDSDSTYYGHLSLKGCKLLRETFVKEGMADENTIFVLNHFSHNNVDITYDVFSKKAEKDGFLTSYDGMELEF